MLRMLHFGCTFCGMDFLKFDCYLKHELGYIGVSEEDYVCRKELQEKVNHTSYTVSVSKNEQTDKAYSDAVDNLIAFEQRLGVTAEDLKKVG